MTTHYDAEFAYSSFEKGACGAYSKKAKFTKWDDLVDCPKCLKALGYEVKEKN